MKRKPDFSLPAIGRYVEALGAPYGLCLYLSEGWYGHGGMYGTEMWNSADGRVTVIYLVQRAGKFPKNGDSGAEIFRRAARDMAAR